MNANAVSGMFQPIVNLVSHCRPNSGFLVNLFKFTRIISMGKLPLFSSPAYLMPFGIAPAYSAAGCASQPCLPQVVNCIGTE